MKKTTTNCKAVKEAVRAHILEYYTPNELKAEVEGIKNNASAAYPYYTNYAAVRHMVEGGCFLVYYTDVVNFLNNLGINPENKQFPEEKLWGLYCHLIARDADLIIKKAI